MRGPCCERPWETRVAFPHLDCRNSATCVARRLLLCVCSSSSYATRDRLCSITAPRRAPCRSPRANKAAARSAQKSAESISSIMRCSGAEKIARSLGVTFAQCVDNRMRRVSLFSVSICLPPRVRACLTLDFCVSWRKCTVALIGWRRRCVLEIWTLGEQPVALLSV